ncbi:MAG: hypothetical protein A2161_11940 [Candidatus Schekmanbacteria bacterium RBG_13_48_7]|uniref:RNA-binding S4 domain-containing protein n=1 Tax=Candidatus Schekmanbacteria bacterium RBG_13_48_7 TaxID=1817878 RepID=A0A1F7S1D7_9BACT|nr:MAG: hypothetical protein A2161_11940 [Candidatus Schekmanbacteria bacterium RBG_13_48_7]
MDNPDKFFGESTEPVRIDRWLMAARFYKTRSQAGQACDGGKIKVNGISAKPGKLVRPGDEVGIQHHDRYRKIRVLRLAQRGLPPATAKLLYEEHESTRLSEADIELIQIQKEMQKKVKRKFKGRPTKKERRDIKKYFR